MIVKTERALSLAWDYTAEQKDKTRVSQSMKEGETVREKQGRDDEYQMSKDSPHKRVTRSG